MYAYRGADDPYTGLAMAHRLALRAVAADPADPEARLALARAAYFSGMPPDSAEPLFDAVLAASPNIPEALIDLAHLNARQGRADSAMALARRAMALDPLSAPIRHGAITAALRVRRADLGLEWARARLAQDPGDRIALALESYALLLASRAAECAERDFGPWLAAQATCLLAAGRPAEAKAVADSLAAMLEREEYATAHQFTDMATYYAWTGRASESLRWLERAAAHTPLMLDWAFTSGLYDPVAEDPEFRDGLERVRQQTLDRLRARKGMLGGEG
jgi:tetratricopeptide (TPR) repeat protein